MIFITCFAIAVVILAATIFLLFRKTENKLVTTGAGVFLAMFVLFFPADSGGDLTNTFNTVIIAIVRSIRVFGLNEDFLISEFSFGELPYWFRITYICLLDFLYFIAPILTFGLILSIFGNLSSAIRLVFSGMRNVYIFSDNNMRSRMIAEDIKKQKPNAVIVFFNSESAALSNRAKAITFSSEISELKPIILMLSRHATFFLCNDDENLNVKNTVTILGIVKNCRNLSRKLKNNTDNRKGIDLYFFSSLKKSVPILNGVDNSGVRVRRINEIQNLVYNFIYENPVLKYADKNNEINIAVIGMGKYGEEFLRAAVWSGQHHDYKLNINAFDERAIKESFALKYPELVDTEKLSDSDEISYKINFFDKNDIFETEIEKIAEMKPVSLVLVALGDDDKNFEASVYLRECFRRMGTNPEIHTIMSEIDLKGIDITNHKKQSYNIDFIPLYDTMNCDNIMNTGLEKMGKEMFRMWNGGNVNEDYSDFYNYDFNYRSSIAATMFWKIRRNLGMDVKVSDENKRLEHWRWNAYMRTEGFRYAEKRNDIAKLHHNLVPYDELDEVTKTNDEYPIRSAE